MQTLTGTRATSSGPEPPTNLIGAIFPAEKPPFLNGFSSGGVSSHAKEAPRNLNGCSSHADEELAFGCLLYALLALGGGCKNGQTGKGKALGPKRRRRKVTGRLIGPQKRVLDCFSQPILDAKKGMGNTSLCVRLKL
jgi:hypothetical protein